MLPKEIDHECEIHKKCQHFLLGHETWSQTNSIRVAKIWKCEVLGCAKIARSAPPFCFACIQALVDHHNTPSKCKMPRLSALDHLTCCYTYPCALMQAFTLKEQMFCSNAYKQALITENEKSESSCASEAFGHKKLH
jgi:hypothetical protein